MYKISPSVYEKADPALLELIERAQFCNLTDEELVRYEAGLKAIEDEIDFEEMLEEAKVKIATEAHAEGIKDQIETAKKMLNMGMSIDLIAEISGLYKEEIEALR